MGKYPNYYNKAVQILQELKKDFPNQSLGQHLATAFDGYADLWSLSDKECAFTLEKYQLQKDLSYMGEDVDKIYQDGLNIDDPYYLNEEEPEEDY